MRGIEVPDREEDFAADQVELFFDLAFVFAFSQLVGSLIKDPTWSGVGEQALLFGLLWLPWTQFTWSANAISGNGRPVRILFLVATAISVPMAAAVSTALDSGGTVFAVSLSIILLLALSMMTLSLDRGTEEFGSAVRYAIPNVIAMVVLIGGSFIDGGGRIAVWIAALAIVLVATIAAGRGDWIVRPGHFAERHGLIIIVALGEVIVAIGIPVVKTLEVGEGIPASTVGSLVAAGAFAGLVLSAAALEEITLHPTDPLPIAFRLMLFAGLTLTFVGVAASIGRTFGVLARERVVAVAVLLVLVLMAGSWDGLWLLIAVDVAILAMLVVEHVRVEQPNRRAARVS